MQLFDCPFCGPRVETEFHFGGDAGRVRPEGHQSVSDATWADYLYFRHNPKGASREIWTHLACQEVFIMERDTVNHKVARTYALQQESAE